VHLGTFAIPRIFFTEICSADSEGPSSRAEAGWWCFRLSGLGEENWPNNLQNSAEPRSQNVSNPTGIAERRRATAQSSRLHANVASKIARQDISLEADRSTWGNETVFCVDMGISTSPREPDDPPLPRTVVRPTTNAQNTEMSRSEWETCFSHLRDSNVQQVWATGMRFCWPPEVLPPDPFWASSRKFVEEANPMRHRVRSRKPMQLDPRSQPIYELFGRLTARRYECATPPGPGPRGLKGRGAQDAWGNVSRALEHGPLKPPPTGGAAGTRWRWGGGIRPFP